MRNVDECVFHLDYGEWKKTKIRKSDINKEVNTWDVCYTHLFGTCHASNIHITVDATVDGASLAFISFLLRFKTKSSMKYSNFTLQFVFFSLYADYMKSKPKKTLYRKCVSKYDTYCCMWNHNVTRAVMAFLSNFIQPIFWLWIVCERVNHIGCVTLNRCCTALHSDCWFVENVSNQVKIFL